MSRIFIKYQVLIFILVALALAAVALLVFVIPAFAHYQEKRAEFSEVRTRLAELVEKQTRLETLAPKITGGSAEDIIKLRRLYVNQPELAELLPLLYRQAQASRTLLTALSVAKGNTEGSPALKELSVQAQFKGIGYDQLRELLRLAGRAVPLLDLVSFTFDPKSGNVNFNLKSYAVRVSNELPSAVDEKFFELPRFRELQRPLPVLEGKIEGVSNPFVSAQ